MIEYCLVDVFVPSFAVTVNVEVVFEPTASAVPENVPLEFKVNPVGIEPEVTEKVTVSPSSSEAVMEVRFDPALSISLNVPKEPLATPNTGEASIFKASAKLPAKFDEVLITWISKGSFALETVFGTCAVTCVELFLVTVGEEISVPFTSINFTFTDVPKFTPVIVILAGKFELSKSVGEILVTVGAESMDLKEVPS